MVVVVFLSVVDGLALIDVVEDVLWLVNSTFDEVLADVVEDAVDVDVVNVVVFVEVEVEREDSPDDEETVPKSDMKVNVIESDAIKF